MLRPSLQDPQQQNFRSSLDDITPDILSLSLASRWAFSHLDGGLHDLEVLSRAGEGAAGTDPRHESIDLAGGLGPQLRASRLAVDLSYHTIPWQTIPCHTINKREHGSGKEELSVLKNNYIAEALSSSSRERPQEASFNQSSFSRGTCLGSIVMLTLSPISMSILAIPILLPQNLPRLINFPAVFNIGLTGLLVVYAIAVFVLAANWAGDILSAREPETWEAVRPTDNEQT